jgi:hypothetical protein
MDCQKVLEQRVIFQTHFSTTGTTTATATIKIARVETQFVNFFREFGLYLRNALILNPHSHETALQH